MERMTDRTHRPTWVEVDGFDVIVDYPTGFGSGPTFTLAVEVEDDRTGFPWFERRRVFAMGDELDPVREAGDFAAWLRAQGFRPAPE